MQRGAARVIGYPRDDSVDVAKIEKYYAELDAAANKAKGS